MSGAISSRFSAARRLRGRLPHTLNKPERMRRIGVLMNRSESDPEGQARVAAFRQAFEQLGWNEGGNIRIDIRWGDGNDLSVNMRRN